MQGEGPVCERNIVTQWLSRVLYTLEMASSSSKPHGWNFIILYRNYIICLIWTFWLRIISIYFSELYIVECLITYLPILSIGMSDVCMFHRNLTCRLPRAFLLLLGPFSILSVLPDAPYIRSLYLYISSLYLCICTLVISIYI